MKITSGQLSVDELVRRISTKRMSIPDYQRPLVWPNKKKRLLIDSVINAKYCIGLIYLHKLDDGTYHIVDGQQRLINLYAYMHPSEASVRWTSANDGSPAGEWATKCKGEFFPWEDLKDQKVRDSFGDAMVPVAEIEGTTAEVIEQFNRLQGGVGLKQGEILHSKMCDPWYPMLTKVLDALSKKTFKTWHKRTLFAGYILAMSEKRNVKIKLNLGGVLEGLGTSACEDVAEDAVKLLGYCEMVDKELLRLNGKDSKYGKYQAETRYTILYNLLYLTKVNKNHLERVVAVLQEHFALPLESAKLTEDKRSELLTSSKGLLFKRKTVDFSSSAYHDVFLPIREELWKIIPKRDERRAFSSEDRAKMYTEASGQCEGCRAALDPECWEAHHVEYWEKGGLTELSNGQALCVSCHKEAHRSGESKVKYTKTAVDLSKVAVV